MRGTMLRAAALAAACLCACSTETKIHVRPEGIDLAPTVEEPVPGRVALVLYAPKRPEDNPSIGGGHADLTHDFVEALDNAGVFREGYHPVLSTHRFEMTMEIEQKGAEDVPFGTQLLMVPTLCTLGLIGPICTYSMDSYVEVVVRLKVRSDVVATYKARTDVQLDYHWGWRNPDLTQGLRACVTATHAQIIRQMIDDKDRLASVLARASAPAPAPAPAAN